MNYRCIHCGALTDTTTHAPFCTCGGLFELDFTPPDWDAAKIDKSECRFSVTAPLWRWTGTAGET